MRVTPSFLLSNPEIIGPLAPWCVYLDNIELGILLLLQPWLGHGGLRRAELERQLHRLANELPFGPIYFQRVSRSVARLEGLGAVRVSGAGRSRGFELTPQGFAVLVLNLSVVRADPTLDGSEFELKRALVGLWRVVVDRMAEVLEDAPAPEPVEQFFDDVESISVAGERVISEETVAAALDIFRLIAVQRRGVELRLREAEARLAATLAKRGSPNDLEQRLAGAAPELVPLLAGAPAMAALAAGLVATGRPLAGLRAAVLRYRRYLDYLDELVLLYAGEVRTVELETVRVVLGRRGR